MAIESYFEDIADAIRERGGTSATLTPAAMPQAILDIPGGGGSSAVLTPVYSGLSYSYISNGSFVGYSSKTNYIHVFELSDATTAAFVLKCDRSGNRFRAGHFPNKTLNDLIENINTPNMSTIAGSEIIQNNTDAVLSAAVDANYGLAGCIIIMTSSESVAAEAFCIDGNLL